MKTVAPKIVGLDPQRLARLDAVMQRFVDDEVVAGVSTLIARYGEVGQLGLYGEMDRESHRPMQEDAIFRIASMTKPVTTVALLMLMEEGRVRLNDPVADYLPAFKDTKVMARATKVGLKLVDQEPEMRVWHLLTHTAGLSYGWNQDTPVDDLYRQAEIGQRDRDPLDWVEALAELPLVFQPGTGWRYSLATDVTGVLVSVIAEMPFADFLRERVFQPLGMPDTAFFVPADKMDRLATLYERDPQGGLKPGHPEATERFKREPVFPSGGGGLVSTISDYYRFAQMLLNGGELDGVRLLGPKTVDLMTRNHLSADLLPFGVGDEPKWGRGFGLGVSVLVDLPASETLGSEGDYGWSGAFTTDFWVDPQEDLVAILMPQLLSMGQPVTIQQDFRIQVYQALVE